MAISLGGVSLSDSIVWSDRGVDQKFAQTRERTLGGKQFIYHQSLSAGRNITLEAQQDAGWMVKSDMDLIRALSESAGITYVFDYNGTLYNVVFRHDDPPAFIAEPLVYRNNQQATDYYTCTIKLVTV